MGSNRLAGNIALRCRFRLSHRLGTRTPLFFLPSLPLFVLGGTDGAAGGVGLGWCFCSDTRERGLGEE